CPGEVQCLTHCGFKDGNPAAGQFCIEARLAAAQRGHVAQGLFFRGAGPLPFGREIRPVRDLIRYLLTGERAAAPPQPTTAATS
ncbi:MAG TPA: nitronate monooxygenase, partial [Chromatiales bacterium]|nr:nitronate monooxygenase [Chromatiales bacterium]